MMKYYCYIIYYIIIIIKIIKDIQGIISGLNVSCDNEYLWMQWKNVTYVADDYT